MHRTFKYKAKLNKQTAVNCLKWLALCRILYNLVLEQRILFWKQRKKSTTAFNQMVELPELKAEFPEFKVVGAQVLQDVVSRLDKTFRNFFRRVKQGQKAGFPRFKSESNYNSFTLRQRGWKIKGRNLYIKNLGCFKLFLSRPIEGRIKTVTVRQTSTNQWFICFVCDNVPLSVFPKVVKTSIGIDVGINSFLTDSEGYKIQNPNLFKKSEKKT